MNKNHKIDIYTLNYCPYCKKAKKFFDDLNLEFNEIPCDENEVQARDELTKKFKLNYSATFPQIEIDGKYIGGYSDLIEQYENGELVL